MKFGKLTDISQVDFALPADPAGNAKVLSNLPASRETPVCYTGCTGWSMPDWIGRIYPKGTKSKDYLKYYSRQFNTIEFNTTHYRIPSAEVVEKWYEESAEDFRFCPKVPQSISHSRDLGLSGSNIHLFCDSILGLKEKLGCCFLQLPPYFGQDRLRLLEKFLQAWPAEIPLAMEARHESWFDSEQHSREFFNLLFRYGKSTVITDVAGRRDVLHMALTSGTAMVRFVGNNLDPTDFSRIDTWAERIKQWFSQGLQEIFFFIHQAEDILVPDLAVYFYQKLENDGHFYIKRPILLDEQEGEQMTLF
ncbi:MAG: DUF72 domain-containing protein [Sinomicrobium sp.]|nr:DUF72 domain-containing protein [Sinomicrobium sp.]